MRGVGWGGESKEERASTHAFRVSLSSPKAYIGLRKGPAIPVGSGEESCNLPMFVGGGRITVESDEILQ